MVFNRFAWFWRFVERQRLRELVADAHAYLYKMGYLHQYSFYGYASEPYDGHHYQVRLELLTLKPLEVHELVAFITVFSQYKPVTEYELFAWDGLRLRRLITE